MNNSLSRSNTLEGVFMYFKKLFLFNFIFLMLLLSSCAIAPTKKFVRTGPTYEERMPQVRRIGIINDVGIARDVVGSDDYFSIEDSKLAESFMLEGTKIYLEQKGYKVDFQFSPFVCAFKVPDKTFKVAEKKGAKVSDVYSPFFVSESLSNDEDYKQALINAIRQVLRSVGEKKNSPSKLFLSDENIQGSLKIIAERTNTEMLLFLIGSGTVVPAGKSVAQGCVTGILTTVLTMGMFTYYRYNVSYLDTYVGLIDIKNSELLWSNSLRLKSINPTKHDFYLKQWPKSILYHITDYKK